MYLPTQEFLSIFAPIKALDHDSAIKIHQTDDIFQLWHSLENESGKVCNVPFWAIAWPAAQASCRFIKKNPNIVQGKSILDLGCGCGVVGIASKLNGASAVTLNDIDPLSIHVSKVNAQLNNISCEFKDCDLTEIRNYSHFDVIFTADCFYEKHSSNRLYNFLIHSIRNGTDVIIADAHRPFAPDKKETVLWNETFAVDVNVEGVTERDVNIFRLSET